MKKTTKKAVQKTECTTFAKNLSSSMKSLGMKQIDLVNKTGLTRAGVSALVNGHRDPQLSTIIKLIKAIPVKFEKLAGLTK